MHHYISGLEKNHEASGADMAVIGGYRLAATYLPSQKENRLTCADITHRPQIIVEGNNAPTFLTQTLSMEEAPEEYSIATSTLHMGDTGLDCRFIAATLSEGRYYLILDAIFDNETKDDVVNWLADEMPDDMTFTVLRDHTLISVQGAGLPDDLWDHMPDMGHVFESETHLYLRHGETATDGMMITLDNNSAPAFWEKLVKRKDVTPMGVHQYEEKRRA